MKADATQAMKKDISPMKNEPGKKRVVYRPSAMTLLDRADPHLLTLNNAIQELRKTAPRKSGPMASWRLKLFDAIREGDKRTARGWITHLKDAAKDIQESRRSAFEDAVQAILELVSEKE